MEIVKENTIAEVVSKKLGSDHIFSKYNIDFCCGGGLTLEAACTEKGITFETLRQEIESMNNKIVGTSSLTDRDLGSLMQMVKTEYYPTIDHSFKEILPLASKVADVHGAGHREVVDIKELLQTVGISLDRTFANTLNRLFPAIDTILSLDNPNAEITFKQLEALKGAVERITAGQSFIEGVFHKIANLSSNYTAPEEACNSYRYLYQSLQQLDNKVHGYMHFEKHVLVPKALKIIA
ncbi:DUF542 domain-containing protein [Maribacter polysiphoniae]|uniref:DUF542 domain-containing protein n=1 Tax=Maribacter polysiphoniae TaxID=429344 RepID=A0A316DT54_9FLAO|nr:DUF542 domain-containing protein [Maribacter polysiphoniae]MBD1262249.1 DUF542 domain-containing protein [Maribacter polysiphoniae]PWK21487.1 iron-sulfur cluster repair di-iron protein [Maribacter polysiphoniae]